LSKNGLGFILGDFFSNSSGHSGGSEVKSVFADFDDEAFSPPNLFLANHSFSFSTLLTRDVAVSCPEQLVFVSI
jgi:hypothetical protein